MKQPPPNKLSVWVGEKVVCIRIEGRANFTSSVDFKSLIYGLWEKGYSYFILDLTQCLLMDSTFLGVLAGMGVKSSSQNGSAPLVLELKNPNNRITDLLENLGVQHLFRTVQGDPDTLPEPVSPMETVSVNASKEDVSRTCLEAHKTLMEINPANVPKFKDVAQFLAEDLKRMEKAS